MKIWPINFSTENGRLYIVCNNDNCQRFDSELKTVEYDFRQEIKELTQFTNNGEIISAAAMHMMLCHTS